MGIMHKNPVINFYDAVSEVNINAENRMFTVCDGEYAGEKVIISEGESAWMSSGDGFFRTHAKDIASVSDNGLFEIDGVRVYSELLGNEKEIVICGAGHVSMPVITIAKSMGCRVTAIDDRESFVQQALSRGADKGICMGFEEALTQIPGNTDTYFIIVTRGHRYDKDCLLNIVKKPHAYIGMIGSRRKVGMVKKSLADAGTPQEIIDSIYTPIGLDIGAETPEEIAVAIMAEIIEVKNRKKRNFGYPADIMKEMLSDEREAEVLVTIVSKKGSSPRGVGTKMLVKEDGRIIETIGGGSIEAAAIKRAEKMLSEPDAYTSPHIMDYSMTGESVEDEGMVCGGAVQLLMEIV